MRADRGGMRGALATYRALENGALALSDQLPPAIADSARSRFIELGWGLKPSQRQALAELLDDIAHELHTAAAVKP